MNHKREQVLILLLILTAALITACSSDDKSARSMDAIHKEEGVPVKIETIKKN